MINKILVAIDNSVRSKLVFDNAVSLAKSFKSILILVHVLSEEDAGYPVLPIRNYYSVLRDQDDGVFKQEFDRYIETNKEQLKTLTQAAKNAGVKAKYIQIFGFPGWEICESASTYGVDLIVVGSRGINGLQEMFLGSVSNYVSHHAPCSVLIVRATTDLESKSEMDAEAIAPQKTSDQTAYIKK